MTWVHCRIDIWAVENRSILFQLFISVVISIWILVLASKSVTSVYLIGTNYYMTLKPSYPQYSFVHYLLPFILQAIFLSHSDYPGLLVVSCINELLRSPLRPTWSLVFKFFYSLILGSFFDCQFIQCPYDCPFQLIEVLNLGLLPSYWSFDVSRWKRGLDVICIEGDFWVVVDRHHLTWKYILFFSSLTHIIPQNVSFHI